VHAQDLIGLGGIGVVDNAMQGAQDRRIISRLGAMAADAVIVDAQPVEERGVLAQAIELRAGAG
jgi:hypothetical protein